MAVSISAAPPSKVRWGELEEEEDGEDYAYLLPPRQIIGPDHNGLKKVIEHKFNDEGNKVKITSTIRVRKLANARLSKRAVERRSWPKFGDAVHEDVGARLTMVSTEEILLERPRAPGTFPLSIFIDVRFSMYVLIFYVEWECYALKLQCCVVSRLGIWINFNWGF